MRFLGFKVVAQDFYRILKIEFLTFLLHPNVLNELLIGFNSKNRPMYMIWAGLVGYVGNWYIWGHKVWSWLVGENVQKSRFCGGESKGLEKCILLAIAAIRRIPNEKPMCKISSQATNKNPIFQTPQICDFRVLRYLPRILPKIENSNFDLPTASKRSKWAFNRF